MSFRYKIRPILAAIQLTLLSVLLLFCIFGAALLARTFHKSPWGLTPGSSSGYILNKDNENAVSMQPQMGVTLSLDSLSPAERITELDKLHESGFTWVRQRFDWALLEAERGHFDWTSTDQILEAIVAAGLEPVIVLDNSPNWAREDKDLVDDTPFAPPVDPQEMAPFATAFAQRYGHHLRYYQIWDEPNIAPHWGNRHIEPIEYARLLYATGNAIRAVDPDAFILTGALAPTADRGHTAMDEAQFLRRLYAATPPDQRLFDGVAIEPFGFAYEPSHPRRQRTVLNFQRVAHLRRVMVAAGDAETPLWAVRFGWSRQSADEFARSGWPTVPEDTQMLYANQAVAMTQQEWPWLTHMGWPVGFEAASNPSLSGFALTDSLADALTALPTRLDGSTQSDNTAKWLLMQIAGLIIGGVAIGWRALTAARYLRRIRLRQGYRRYPVGIQVFALAVIVLIYHLAVSPILLFYCLIAAALLFLNRPLYGLYLAALLLPFDFQHKNIAIVNWEFTLAPAHAILIALGPALLRQAAVCRKSKAMISFSLPDWLALGWLLLGLLSFINSWHGPAYLEGLIDLVIMPLLLYGAVRILINNTNGAKLASAFVTGGLLVALIGLIQWVQGMGTEADGVRRLVGTQFSPNHTALYLERTLVVALGLMLGARARRSAAFFIITGIMAAALLLTVSRGALVLGVPAGLFVLYWMGHRRLRSAGEAGDGSGGSITLGDHLFSLFELKANQRRIAWFLGLIAALGLIAGSILFWERLSNSATIIRRLQIWQASLDLWRDYLLLGVGPGGFFWRYPAYILENLLLDPNLRHPHNLWLEIGTMTGALGLVWLIALLWWLWRRAQNELTSRYSWLTVGLLASLAAGLAHGQVDAFAALADVAAANWLLLGLLQIDEGLYKQRN